jgi:diaminopimelate epimerase
VKFTKMHGIGNDYVYLDAVSDPAIEQRPGLPELARAISDRHTGVGSDGLILICRPAEVARGSPATPSVRMRMFNADGSESEMCGNGLRCVAKFAHDRLGINANPMLVQTGRGKLSVSYEVDPSGKLRAATVDMGEPILDPGAIPVDLGRLKGTGRAHEYGIEAAGETLNAVFVSMGNPHAVIFTEPGPGSRSPIDPQRLSRLGPAIERHDAFPRRTNVHFATVLSPVEVTMCTWERGAGATLACGTGACAVLVAGVIMERLNRSATLHLPGGDLRVRWDQPTNHVFMTGPATEIFDGVWPD